MPSPERCPPSVLEASGDAAIHTAQHITACLGTLSRRREIVAAAHAMEQLIARLRAAPFANGVEDRN